MAAVVSKRVGALVMGLIGVAVAVAVVPGQARAGDRPDWTRPQAIVDAGQKTAVTDIAAGPNGYAVVTWLKGRPPQPVPAAHKRGFGADRRLFASVREPGEKRFGAPQALSQKGASLPELDMSPDGDTVVTWRTRTGSTKAAFRSPTTDFGEPQTVAGPEAGHPISLAVGTEGNAILTFNDDEYTQRRILAALRPPGGEFATPTTVAIDEDPQGNWGPLAAAGADGTGMVAWSGACPLFDPDAREPAMASVLEPGGTFATPEGIPESQCPDAGIEVAMDNAGTGIVLINGSLKAWGGIRAAVRPPDGPFGQAELISRKRERADFGLVGMDGEGHAIAVWDRFDRGHLFGVEAAIRPADGAFSEPGFITGRHVSGSDLSVSEGAERGTIDPVDAAEGQLPAAWRRQVGPRAGLRAAHPWRPRAASRGALAVGPRFRRMEPAEPSGNRPRRLRFTSARKLNHRSSELCEAYVGRSGGPARSCATSNGNAQPQRR
jgi:hypothetical protein